jgi:hypothetical protein
MGGHGLSRRFKGAVALGAAASPDGRPRPVAALQEPLQDPARYSAW